jgi:hypothetical protein
MTWMTLETWLTIAATLAFVLFLAALATGLFSRSAMAWRIAKLSLFFCVLSAVGLVVMNVVLKGR